LNPITRGNFLHVEVFPKKSESNDHFDRSFSFTAMTEKYETEKEINSTTPASTKRKEQ